MKINNTLIFTIGFYTSIATLLATEPVRTNDTSNVGHQFYDALVKTPAEAFSHVAHATHDVASAIANSDVGHELKTAGKQLAVEAPVKAGYAIKNGVVKAARATAHGARTAYDATIRKPAHAVKNVASDVIESTKEAAIELGEQFADAGVQVKDATAYGAQKVYHLLIRKPVGAIKAAAHYLVHSDDEVHPVDGCIFPEHFVQANEQIYVAIVLQANDPINENGRPEAIHVNHGEPITINRETATIPREAYCTFGGPSARAQDLILELEIETPQPVDLGNAPLSQSTMDKVADAFNAIKQDLCNR